MSELGQEKSFLGILSLSNKLVNSTSYNMKVFYTDVNISAILLGYFHELFISNLKKFILHP